MKQILLSVGVIAAALAIASVGTTAFFSDTEKSTGNTFSAGTIDISVDGQNPWVKSEPLTIRDMKPSQHAYSEYVIQNTGTNPANLFKKVDITAENDGENSEPECIEGGGIWGLPPEARAVSNMCYGNYVPKFDLATSIRYDMSVWVYDVDPTQNPTAEPKWWQIIYTDGMNKRLSDVNGQETVLGMVPAGWFMKVRQSYHMDSETTNWAQGDAITFDITLKAEQLTGSLTLQAKDFADQANPTLRYDGKIGTLNYIVKDDKFNFSFAGVAPLANTNYSLIMYKEPFSNPGASGWPRDVIVLATASSDAGGNVAIPQTSLELGTVTNMKVWLVTSADLTGNTMTSFNGANYLFELGLMDYYESI